MLKIRRIHLVNAGYEEATFDGEAFDFRDPLRDVPGHCVLHAENGTGKTTALGLIFNIPVPKEARFLPHLVKPDYEFADYFPRGVGVVAIEWHDPAGRHPVTVHFVVPQLRGSERQTWRRWALFRSAPGLAFDDLPLKGLRSQSRTVFASRDDVAQWLRAMEERFADSHDFEAAASQDAWRRILERHGIDTHLMDSQLEFNRQEGGLDSFLRMHNEEDFIARFLALCLVSPDQGPDAVAEPVCAQVRAIVAKMQGYDALVAKRELLRDIAQAFRPFAAAAQDWREQRRNLARAETHAASVRQAAGQRADTLEAEAGEAERAAEDHARRAAGLRSEAERAELSGEAARLALADLRARHAAEALLAATARAESAERDRTRLSAARDLREIFSIEVEIAEYERALSEAEAEAAEPRRRAHEAGAGLSAMLAHAIAAHRDAMARHQSEARAAETDRDQARMDRDRLANEIVQAQRQDAVLETQIRIAEAALADLRADGVLRPGEPVAACLGRLERERDEAQAAARDAQARAAGHAAEAAARAANEAEAEAERREALAHAQAERQSIDRAERTRGELTGRDIWRHYLGAAQTLAPEAALTAQRLAREQRTAGERARASAALMREDADRIARHRVAAVDRNVDLVLAQLSEHGLRSAIAAASWLADIVADERRLRAFAAADPAAFAGIFVQDPAELGRVPDLDFFGLALDRPVAILAPAEQPGQALALAVVPGRAEAYDIAAAEALVENLGTKVNEAELAAEAAFSAADALSGLKAAIEAWIAEWGEGRLEASRRRMAELEDAARLAQSRAADALRSAESERAAAASAQLAARREQERGAAAERGHAGALLTGALRRRPAPMARGTAQAGRADRGPDRAGSAGTDPRRNRPAARP